MDANTLTIFEVVGVILASAGSVVIVAKWFLGRYIEQQFSKHLVRFQDEIERKRSVSLEVWLTKREACLHALNIANAVLSNYKYRDPETKDDIVITPQEHKIEDVRACFNELACTCESPEVIRQLRRIMHDRVNPAAIIDLRNAVRRELNFSTVVVDEDLKQSFVGTVNCDPRSRQVAT